MYRWAALIFFTLLAILAVAFGFGGLTFGAGTGKVLFIIFLVACAALLIWGIYFGRRPPPVPPNPPPV